MSRPAKALVKIAAVACVAFWLYAAYAVPYGGAAAIVPAAIYFVIAFALIWLGDRLTRGFR